MKIDSEFKGLLFLSHDELFVVGKGCVPEGVFSKSVSSVEHPFTIMPLPGGISDDRWSGEVTEYLKYGQVLRSSMTLSDNGSGLSVAKLHAYISVSPSLPGRMKMSNLEETQLAEAQDFARKLAEYRNSYMNSGLKVDVKDWQGEERADKTTPDSIKILIDLSPDRLSLHVRDGRRVDIELQDGNLRVLAYESEEGKEAPVVTILPREGDIITERSDYDREDRPEMDEDSLTP